MSRNRKILIAVGGVLAAYLLYRWYQGRAQGATPAAQTAPGTADQAATDYAALSGQEQSDVAGLQGQNAQLQGAEQSDISNLQGIIGQNAANEQSDIAKLQGQQQTDTASLLSQEQQDLGNLQAAQADWENQAFGDLTKQLTGKASSLFPALYKRSLAQQREIKQLNAGLKKLEKQRQHQKHRPPAKHRPKPTTGNNHRPKPVTGTPGRSGGGGLAHGARRSNPRRPPTHVHHATKRRHR